MLHVACEGDFHTLFRFPVLFLHLRRFESPVSVTSLITAWNKPPSIHPVFMSVTKKRHFFMLHWGQLWSFCVTFHKERPQKVCDSSLLISSCGKNGKLWVQRCTCHLTAAAASVTHTRTFVVCGNKAYEVLCSCGVETMQVDHQLQTRRISYDHRLLKWSYWQ